MANNIEPISYIRINEVEHPIDALSISGKSISEIGELVTFIDENSTDDQYPSAKCLYDLIYGNDSTPTPEQQRKLRMYVDNFIRDDVNIEDWVNNPNSCGANEYIYTGNTINYNNNTYYIWERTDGNYDNVRYAFTTTINYDTLYQQSLENNLSNILNHTITYFFDDSMQIYSDCETQSLIKVQQTDNICIWVDDFVRDSITDIDDDRILNYNIGSPCYEYLESFEYDNNNYYLWKLVNNLNNNINYILTDTINYNTLRSYSLESNLRNITVHPTIIYLNNDFEEEYIGEDRLDNIIKVFYYDHNYSKDYLTFEALEDTTFNFTRNSLEYSVDYGNTWVNLPANTNTPTVASGDKIMFKKTNPTIKFDGIGTFSSTGSFNASGNIMSLLYGDDFDDQISLSEKNGCFAQLFANCAKIINTSNLILPATTLSNDCYNHMFYNCTSLTTAPELPATTLSASCYYSMFDGCTSLTTAPKLPATTLALNCYHSMFCNCTSLTTAPELPAKTLDDDCYHSMFDGCTSLTTAPELPATTLSDGCYASMFDSCTSLTTSPILPATDINVYACYYGMFSGCTNLRHITCYAEGNYDTYNTEYWVYGVSASGTFTCRDDSIWTRGGNGIPQNWTTNIDTYDLFNSAGLYGMYIDDFLKTNPNDFIEDPINNNCNAYEYTGDSISYDGGNYYIWKNMGYMTSNSNGNNKKCYVLTSTINQNTLQQKSLEHSLSNLLEYPIYIYLDKDGNEYSSGQSYNIVSVSQTTGLEMWIDEDFDYGWEDSGYSDMEEYLDWYLDNIDEAGGKYYYYIDTFEYDGNNNYIWYCYIDGTYLVTDTNNVNTLTSYSIESDYSNVNTHPIITFLNKDLTEYDASRSVSDYSIVKVTNSQPKQMMYVDDFVRNDIDFDSFIDDPESNAANYYEYCEDIEYNGNTYYVWRMIKNVTYSNNVKYILTDTINLQTLQSYSLESSITNISTFPIVTYLNRDFDETYTNENKFDNIIKVFEL